MGNKVKETQCSQMWNLDSLFPGGSQSAQFHNHLKGLEIAVNEFEKSVKSLQIPTCIEESDKIGNLIF